MIQRVHHTNMIQWVHHTIDPQSVCADLAQLIQTWHTCVEAEQHACKQEAAVMLFCKHAVGLNSNGSLGRDKG